MLAYMHGTSIRIHAVKIDPPERRVENWDMTARQTTTVSRKGQVIIPAPIRKQRQWDPGTRLIVEDTPEGVLLKSAPLFAPTRPEDVFGSLSYKGPPKSLEEMDAGIDAKVRQRRARGRY